MLEFLAAGVARFMEVLGFFQTVVISFMEWKERVLGKVVEHFPLWISPNELSLARIPCSILIIPPIFTAHYKVAFSVFLFAAILDLFDGALARQRKQETDFGKIIDGLTDKMVFLGALMALIYTTHPESISRRLMWTIAILELTSALFALGRKGVALFWKKTIEVGSNFFGRFKAVDGVLAICIYLLDPLDLTYQIIASRLLWIYLVFLILSISYHVFCTLTGKKPFKGFKDSK